MYFQGDEYKPADQTAHADLHLCCSDRVNTNLFYGAAQLLDVCNKIMGIYINATDTWFLWYLNEIMQNTNWQLFDAFGHLDLKEWTAWI